MTSASTAPPPRLHTLAEVAQKYGLLLRPLRERARAGRFTHIHIGRERYLTDDMVTALLATFTVAGSSRPATDKREAELARVAERLARQQARPSRRKPASRKAAA